MTPTASSAGSKPCVLVVNGGSSSIKYALYEVGVVPERKAHGEREHTASDPAASFTTWLEQEIDWASVRAVGHRIVHGMAHSEPERVTAELLRELHAISPYDPDHLPLELELLEAVRQRAPSLPQVACFDTAFHRSMPRVATQLPIPRRYEARGLQRYGFHGLSYAYLMQELLRLGDPAATCGRVILAHLGSGASMAAVRDGKSIDTSMGFTPSAGLMMGTRSGDLDPGVAPYLSRTQHLSTQELFDMVNHESGLLGVSETSADVRQLLAREHADVRAAEALALYCYQAKKYLGAYTAALGGLDTLVFSAGVGENASLVRSRICQDLGVLGIELDHARNALHAPVISSDGSRVTVRVIHTDEALMIARAVLHVCGPQLEE